MGKTWVCHYKPEAKNNPWNENTFPGEVASKEGYADSFWEMKALIHNWFLWKRDICKQYNPKPTFT